MCQTANLSKMHNSTNVKSLISNIVFADSYINEANTLNLDPYF